MFHNENVLIASKVTSKIDVMIQVLGTFPQFEYVFECLSTADHMSYFKTGALIEIMSFGTDYLHVNSTYLKDKNFK